MPVFAPVHPIGHDRVSVGWGAQGLQCFDYKVLIVKQLAHTAHVGFGVRHVARECIIMKIQTDGSQVNCMMQVVLLNEIRKTRKVHIDERLLGRFIYMKGC